MAFRQYKDALVKEELTGAEKIHFTDADGSFKQASIKDIVAKGSQKNDYLTIKKIKDYLFETHYGVIDYGNAYAYFASLAEPIDMGFCSAVRNGNWYGRNLDWIYDNNAEFIVHTPHIAGRCASLAVAGGFAELTNDFVTSEAYSDLYKLVPFRLYDGINEYGVIMNMNVVPTDNGTNVSLPTEQEEVTISAQMLIRYVLDNFKTANDAVEYIQKHMKIYFPISLHNKQYELHFMIADENNTYVVEFVDNAAVVFDATENSNSIFAGKPYMTNFYLNGVTLNDDGTVYTPGTQTADYNAKDTNGITDCGAGLERYNYIVDAYDSANTKDGMRAMMNGLKYTRAYSTAPDVADPVWLTEYVGVQGLTVTSDPEDFDVVVQYAGGMFNDRSRTDGLTWQTVHSAVYDIENRALNIIVQEDGEELECALDGFERKDNPEPVVLPPEVENAVATHGMGWTVSTVGDIVVEETVYTSDASGKICTTGLDIETPCVTYPNPGQMLCVCNGVECDVEVGYGHNDEYDENFYSMNITHDGEQVLYLWQLEDNFYVINGNTPQPNQAVDFVIYSVDNEVNQIAEKYMPEKVSNAIETGGLGWTSEQEVEGFDITWDGDTEGLEMFWDSMYKVFNNPLTKEELIGSNIIIDSDLLGNNFNFIITEDMVLEDYDDVFLVELEGLEEFALGYFVIASVLEDTTIDEESVSRGLYFINMPLYVNTTFAQTIEISNEGRSDYINLPIQEQPFYENGIYHIFVDNVEYGIKSAQGDNVGIHLGDDSDDLRFQFNSEFNDLQIYYNIPGEHEFMIEEVVDLPIYTSQLYKEASTEETVHQIDQKYIPTAFNALEIAVGIDWSANSEPEFWGLIKGTYDEILEAVKAGRPVTGYVYQKREPQEYNIGPIGKITCVFEENLEGTGWAIYLDDYGWEIRPNGSIDMHD